MALPALFDMQVSTLVPWLVGLRFWRRHRESLVCALRFLRVAAAQGVFTPQARDSSSQCCNSPCHLLQTTQPLPPLEWLQCVHCAHTP